MVPTFEYAAACYLDDWLYYDSRYVDVIGYPADLAAQENVRKTLIDAATYYKVIRNFPLELDDDRGRLQDVLDFLSAAQEPKDENEAITLVNAFVSRLQRRFHIEPWSAASKFFGFDSRVRS